MHDVSITSRSTSSIYKDMQTYQFTLFIGTGDTNKSDVTFIIRTTIHVKGFLHMQYILFQYENHILPWIQCQDRAFYTLGPFVNGLFFNSAEWFLLYHGCCCKWLTFYGSHCFCKFPSSYFPHVCLQLMGLDPRNLKTSPSRL